MDIQSGARAGSQDFRAGPYAWYVVSLLMLVHIVAYVDRYLMSLLIEPIKRSLDLSDFQIGLLIGPAFVFLFVALGVPIGYLVDRRNRRSILAVGIALWSLMTAACGLAKSFGTLFLARVGVGIGEASAAPCCISLISDYFPPASRPRAVGLWMMGAPVGAGATYLVGGAIIEMIDDMQPLVLPVVGALEGWQTAFLAIGLPGTIIALLLRATVTEPLRRERSTRSKSPGDPSIKDAVKHFSQQKAAYGSVFTGIVGITAIGASSFWIPALFERTWGWGVGRTGFAVGLVLLTTGMIGTNLGGWLAARWIAAGRPHGAYLTVSIGAVIVLPAFALFPLMPTAEAAIALVFIGMMGMSITSGTSPSSIVAITPGELRGQMTAVFWMVINLFGALVGPPMVGIITDVFGDPQALRYGMSITTVFFGVVMLGGLWLGRAAYRASASEMARISSQSSS
jgi:MFS family permease